MEEMDNGESTNFLHLDRLPNGWIVTPISSVCQIEMGQSPPSSTYNREKVGLPFFQGKAEFGDFYPTVEKYCSDPKKIAPESSVLISVRAPVGPTNFAREKSCIGRGLAAISPLNQISSRFILYFFRAIEPALSGQGTGSTFKAISGKYLKGIPLHLPPINEQYRIVAKIEELFSELDKGVESLKTARAQLKTYRQSLLKAAFEGRLTEQWRRDNADKLETAEQLLQRIRKKREARYQQQLEEWKAAVVKWEANGKAGRKPKKPTVERPLPEFDSDEADVLPGLPKAWRYVRLATLAAVGSGMAVSKSRMLDDPVEVSYLRVANVQRGRLVLDEIKSMVVERTSLEDLRLKKWDVLFNEGGDRDKLGRGWVWEDQIAPCITQNHVFRATTYMGDEFHAKFISYWGNVFGRDYFEKVGKQTTNLASINKSVLKMFPVPVPPYVEQQEIVRRIEEAESQIVMLEEQIEDGLNRSENLRQSVLKRAFEGKLVPQDPDDEPASALLERIRQEQADAPKANRRKRKTGARA